MSTHFLNERRRYRRYIVPGRVWFSFDSVPVAGELVNFGQGGILFRSSAVLPEGGQVTIHIVAFCYPVAFEVQGEICRVRDDLIALQFLNQPQGMFELLLWLDRENFPWTGTSVSADMDLSHSLQRKSSQLLRDPGEIDVEDSLEHIYQQG